MKCEMCGKEFDSSYDFIEDEEAVTALNHFVETERLCGNCGWKLIDEITEFAHNRVSGC